MLKTAQRARPQVTCNALQVAFSASRSDDPEQSHAVGCVATGHHLLQLLERRDNLRSSRYTVLVSVPEQKCRQPRAASLRAFRGDILESAVWNAHEVEGTISF